MVEVLILVALAYIGYQLRRLIRFIESRQQTAMPKPPRFARVRAAWSSRVFVPLTGVSVNGAIALLYSVLLGAVGVAWALSALSNAH